MKVYIVIYKTSIGTQIIETHKAFSNKKNAIKFQSHVKRGMDVLAIRGHTTRIQMDIPINSKGIIKSLNFHFLESALLTYKLRDKILDKNEGVK